MARGRRSLAIGLSIAVHAAIGAAFLLIRPALREPARQAVQVRVVSNPKPATQSAPGNAENIGENIGPATRNKPAPKPRSTVKSAVAEGSVAAIETTPEPTQDGTETSTTILARRSAAGNSGSVLSTAPIDLDVKIGAGETAPDLLASNLKIEKGPALKPSGGGTYQHEDSMFRARIEADGTVELEDKIVPVPRVGMSSDGKPSVEIPLDFTDTILRTMGDDPYAYEKRKFLAETQELRAQMAEQACKENLDASLLDIKPRMSAIWENRRLSHAEKKKRLFALWDECAEEGSRDILRTSELIRASILGFIAEHLPPESHLAYSENDLAALNATRRSRAEFLPYGRLKN